MIYLYNGNPTGGEQNGTKVSSGEDFSNAIEFKLNSATGEQKDMVCAVRCDTGFKVDGAVTVSLEGEGADRFQLGPHGGNYSEYGASITLNDVEDSNVLLYVRCKANQGETPAVSKDVKIVLEATIAAK